MVSITAGMGCLFYQRGHFLNEVIMVLVASHTTKSKFTRWSCNPLASTMGTHVVQYINAKFIISSIYLNQTH